MPQTATVKRSEAKLTRPVIDGAPKPAPIPGTPPAVRRQHVDADHRRRRRTRTTPSRTASGSRHVGRRPVGRRDVGAGRHLRDPAELAAALRHLRADLRLDLAGGVRRLHARLPGHVRRPGRRRRLRHRLLLRRRGSARSGTARRSPTATARRSPTRPGPAGPSASASAGPGAPRRPAGAGGRIPSGARGATAAAPGGAVPTGPRGAGGRAAGPATTGNVYTHWGSTTARHALVGGFNAWTGNEWANHVGGVVQLAHRHAGGRPARRGRQRLHRQLRLREPWRGGQHADRAAASGSRVTVGNAYTGQSASASRAQVYNPRTGRRPRGVPGTPVTTSTRATMATCTSATRAGTGSSTAAATADGATSTTPTPAAR